MTKLSTTYMGLKLSNPLIVSSSGLTQTVEDVRRCADAGAGAVVLKSIFEEQIEASSHSVADAGESAWWHAEAAEYILQYGRENAVDEYLRLISDCKAQVDIPVIASIHCSSAGSWIEFAKRAEAAGAAAIELNLFVLPSDPRRTGEENETLILDIARKVKEQIKIPVALKLGSYFSGLARTMTTLSRHVDALVLFNRFVRMDFDAENFSVVPAETLSQPGEHTLPLRWTAILSSQVDCDIATTTGVHDGITAVKMLLAGASAVQVCSALYRQGMERISSMRAEIEDWMQRHEFASIEEFRGKMAQEKAVNPAGYERVQFMKVSTRS